MERVVYPPYQSYPPHQHYGSTFAPSPTVAPRPPSQQKQPSWKQSKGSGGPANPYRGARPAPSSVGLGLGPPPPVTVSAPACSDYLEPCKRAQLKALLSQVSPSLSPRLLRKGATKEVGVQVNPRVDAAVQCSLGSRPLQAVVRPQSPSSARPPTPTPLPGVYSPILGRRLFTLPEAVVEPQEQPDQGPAASQQLVEEEPEEEERKEAKAMAIPEGGDLLGKDGNEENGTPAEDRDSSGGEGKRTTFQFLEQKYGYFHCNDCKTRWESAYVWCISGTNKVYFKQLCRKCQKSFNPYKVEAIQCQICSKSRCSCPQKKRHIDLKRPHRQELCGRCKGKRLSCDNTYSFKYIV